MELPFSVTIRGEQAAQARALVQCLIGGTVNAGPVSALLPEVFTQTVRRMADHVVIEWAPPIEADVPLLPIDPDVLRVRLYEGHAMVETRAGDLRVGFGV